MAEEDSQAAPQDSGEALASSPGISELLVREMSHRVLNAFQMMASMLRLQARTVNHPESRDAFEAAIARVHALGLVHRQLYAMSTQTGPISLATYVENLCADLRHALIDGLTRQDLTSHIDPDIRCASDRAITVGIIITELVTNARKYAHRPDQAGRIMISAQPRNAAFELAVEDDGAGLPPGFDPGQSTGLGMTIVRAQVLQLGSELKIATGPWGSRFSLLVMNDAPPLQPAGMRLHG